MAKASQAQRTDASSLPLIRTGERSSFKRCRWQWYRTYVDRLQPAEKGNALRFGLLVHDALERYYIPGRKRGPHPAATFLELFDVNVEELGHDWGQRDLDDQWLDAREMGEDMLTRYVDHYREEDKLWEIISPEIPAMVVVPDKNGKPIARYLMQFDLTIKHHGSGRYLFVDHKTAKSIPNADEKELDEQAGAYWTFGPEFLKSEGHIPKDAEISGFVFNYLRKAVGDDRPRNERGHYLNKPTKAAMVARCEELGLEIPRGSKTEDVYEILEFEGENPDLLGEVSKSQPPPYFSRFTIYKDEAERENVLYRVRSEVHEMNLVKQGKLGVYKNFMFGGIGACNMCHLYAACQLHETGGDWEELIEMTHTVGDPYEQYREDLDIEEN